MNQPPKDRMLRPGNRNREVVTKPQRPPLVTLPNPVMSPETPGYEEYLRRQNRKP